MAFPPGLRVGRYEVVRKLGQGGFGIIFVGRDTELDREVALKFLRPEHLTRPDVVQRFLQEARSAAKIQHPGIVTVFECGQVSGTNTRADDTVYIAMELLHGESLHVRLKREKRLAPDLAVNITRQVCSALMAAHVAGIVHRDLKPDNLFLVPDSAVRGGMRVKILDFGVAKLADGQFSDGVRTHSSMLLGTPMYMSPEQCKSSAKVDHRSDIYAVGCILFQLLCGRAPYEGDAGELIAQHQLAPIPTPRSFAPELPEPLEMLLTQMLAKAPDERPSMDAVESALASLDATSVIASKGGKLAHAPTVAAKNELAPTSVTTLYEGVGEQTALEQKKQRRNLVLGAIGVIAFGVLLGVIVTRGGKDSEQTAQVTSPSAVTPAPPPPPPGPAPTLVPVESPDASNPDIDELALRCTKLRADRKWPDLVSCGDELSASDPVKGKEFHDLGIAENKAEANVRRMNDAAKSGDVDEARKLLDAVPKDSVYRREAEDQYDKADERDQAIAAAAEKKKKKPDEDPDVEMCDAEALKKKGDDYLGNGMDTAALAQFEASLRCKYDSGVVKTAFLAACRSKQSAKAKLYYAKLPPNMANNYSNICLRFGITVP